MRLLDIIVGYDCNLFCDYCTITPAMRRRALTPAAVANALREGRRLGLTAVSFTGGEPTIRADLLPLVREARRLGYADIKVQSNGLLLARGSNVDRLVAAGVTRFHVSIHTHDPALYERMVQREGTFAEMEAGLGELVVRGLDPVADVILSRDTYERLPDAMRWLHERGVLRADLWFVSLTDQNADNVDSMPAMTDVVPVMARAFAFARSAGIDVRSLHVPRCLLGADAVHAHDPAAQGVRVVTPDATFDLRGSKLTGQRHVPACAGCEHEAYCPGLRDDYLRRFGDAEIAGARGQPATLPAEASPTTSPLRTATRLPVVR